MTKINDTETKMENLLGELTDALLSGETDFDYIIEKHNIPDDNVNEALAIVHLLQAELTLQKPSTEFVRELKNDLVGQGGMFTRLSYVPVRVQITAGLAVFSGFAYIMGKRVTGEDQEEEQDISMLHTVMSSSVKYIKHPRSLRFW
jgi:hypothetical protein